MRTGKYHTWLKEMHKTLFKGSSVFLPNIGHKRAVEISDALKKVAPNTKITFREQTVRKYELLPDLDGTGFVANERVEKTGYLFKWSDK